MHEITTKRNEQQTKFKMESTAILNLLPVSILNT